MKSTIRMATACALLMGMSATSVVHAYTLFTCNGSNIRWNGSGTTLRASGVSFPAGVWQTSLSTSIGRTNENAGAFDFSVLWNEPAVGLGNGENEVWFSSGFGAPAITNLWWNCNTSRFTEADVRFDNTVAYTTSMAKVDLIGYAGSNRPFQTTALHELGHALGLAHTANTYNIMGQDWTHTHANGSTTRSYLGEDANNGIVALYGTNPGTVQDLSISHWRHTGSSGEYSTHSRTRILTSTGGAVSFSTVNGEPRYNVTKGQSYLIEFTYENNGETGQSTEVGYFVSTNDIITAATDTRIGGRDGMFLARDTAFTFQAPITIPSNLTSGTNYWIGAIVDEDGTLSEVTETNNATYIGIRVN